MKRSVHVTEAGLHRPCPGDFETATEYYEGGSGVNDGICVGCGCPREDHGDPEAVAPQPASNCQ